MNDQKERIVAQVLIFYTCDHRMSQWPKIQGPVISPFFFNTAITWMVTEQMDARKGLSEWQYRCCWFLGLPFPRPWCCLCYNEYSTSMLLEYSNLKINQVHLISQALAPSQTCCQFQILFLKLVARECHLKDIMIASCFINHAFWCDSKQLYSCPATCPVPTILSLHTILNFIYLQSPSLFPLYWFQEKSICKWSLFLQWPIICLRKL